MNDMFFSAFLALVLASFLSWLVRFTYSLFNEKKRRYVIWKEKRLRKR